MAGKKRLLELIEIFKGKKIAVIGDIMLDKYIWGEVDRVSPEAPVQVVSVQKENYVPGGAANVANNIAALGGKAYMLGIVGNDNASSIMFDEMQKRGIVVDGVLVDDKKPTIQKIRILGRNQQLLRIDYENNEDINDKLEDDIFEFIEKIINEVDAVIVSDYAKGVITRKLMEKLIHLSNEKGKKIIVDPKPKHADYYAGASLITPNTKEAMQIYGKEEEDILKIGNYLKDKLDSDILITRSEKGMALFDKAGVSKLKIRAKEVYDVTGAGDTVVAAMALSLAAGASCLEGAMIANHAAGIVVAKLGTSTLNLEELKENIIADEEKE